MLTVLCLALLPTVLAWSSEELSQKAAAIEHLLEIPHQVCTASLLQVSSHTEDLNTRVEALETDASYVGTDVSASDARIEVDARYGIQFDDDYGKCYLEALPGLPGLCQANQSMFTKELDSMAVPGSLSRKPWLDDGAELVKQMRILQKESEDHDPFAHVFTVSRAPISDYAYESFENLRKLDARKVLAFRETWTDEDTELLKSIDSEPDEFVDGNLTTEKMRSYLPSISILEDLVRLGTVAVVGGGRSVRGFGSDIDNHSLVVRFNNHLAKEFSEHDTGTRMDVHILNHMVDFNATAEANIVHMDLESAYPAHTWCKRWRGNPSNGNSSTKYSKATLAIRPTAFCGLPNIMGFTRGFLFYWLVGRLFEKVDLYGMAESDSIFHYGRGAVVNEPYLSFEHFLYKTVRQMQTTAKVAALAERPEARDGKYKRPHAPVLAQVAALETPAWASHGEHLGIYD